MREGGERMLLWELDVEPGIGQAMLVVLGIEPVTRAEGSETEGKKDVQSVFKWQIPPWRGEHLGLADEAWGSGH